MARARSLRWRCVSRGAMTLGGGGGSLVVFNMGGRVATDRGPDPLIAGLEAGPGGSKQRVSLPGGKGRRGKGERGRVRSWLSCFLAAVLSLGWQQPPQHLLRVSRAYGVDVGSAAGAL